MQKKLKIVGIGNAIIDSLCKVDDQFLNDRNLTKSSMSLIGEDKIAGFLSLIPTKISCGGSVANSIATLAELGENCEFFGIVGDDHLGKKFVEDLKSCGAKFSGDCSKSGGKTATSFIMITPDASRTMCTFLGCASEISEKNFSDQTFANADLVYIEGYLWDGKKTIAALQKAINLAKKQAAKIAFTLSDSFCVQRHKADFIELVSNQIDILFANEGEILELFDLKSFSSQILQEIFNINPNLTAAITRGEKGCVIFQNKKIIDLSASSAARLLDTTGAGDSFAAGFLFGLSNQFSLVNSGKYGNFLASKVIQKIGARFESGEVLKIKSEFYVE